MCCDKFTHVIIINNENYFKDSFYLILKQKNKVLFMKIKGTPEKGIFEFKKDHKQYADFGFRFNGKHRTIEVSGRIKTDHPRARVDAVYSKVKAKIEKTDSDDINKKSIKKIVTRTLHHKSDLKSFKFENKHK